MADRDDSSRRGTAGQIGAALRRWDQRRGPSAPPFAGVRRRIARAPAPMDARRWPAARSLRLAAGLSLAQVRVVPWVVLPVALVSATVASLAARYFGAIQDASAAASGFTSVILIGIVLTMTTALSRSRSDAIALATPLGPQAVVLARTVAVLCLDVLTALVGSAVVAAWGVAGSFATVAAGWLVPLALVASLVTFATIWTAPWAGVVVGLIAVPVLAPPATFGQEIGLAAVASALRDAAPPAVVVLVGVALFVVAIASARRALQARRPGW